MPAPGETPDRDGDDTDDDGWDPDLPQLPQTDRAPYASAVVTDG